MSATNYARAVVQFNRVTPVRYFAVDIAIFCLPLVLGSGGRPLGPLAVAGLASWLFVRGAALTIDDYFDAESDAIEKPHRPIPSGRVTKRQALVVSLTMLAVGLLLAVVVGPMFLLAVGVLLAVLASDPLVFNKLGLPGISTLVTVTSVSTASVMGWLVYGGLGVELLVMFAATWVWDLSHDTVGAFLDRDGDREADIQSLGRNLSRRTVGLVVGGCTVAFAILLGTVTEGVGTVVPVALAGVVFAVTAGFAFGRVRAETVRRVVEWNVVGSYAALTGLLLANWG
ncbi:UbiA family prenyltransferase [Haloarcula sp. S1CR25-12]|uniref:UbiA family prenyltransferase n=1 Tax=Haloarcula saliterrae TaxID=2950534 RepID=A0ABU2FG63_9EURY|nr:UbiA family prenyltransferase [Haloarcula sp. S1CR25-12]MDS0261252.1 UbiA family prenyltransferase [Haloarcula sp. S1CR25-12]